MAPTVQDTLKGYIEDQLLDQGDEADVAVEDDLLATGLDSMSLIGLITFIEVTFDLHIPPEDVTIESFGTIARIAAYLETLGRPQ